jgi:hypothetical protein
MGAPDVFNHNTSVLLGGIDYARIIELINGYTITFDDTGGAWVCNLVCSNNNILDVTNLTSVQVRSNNSAGLINVTEIQQDIFSGAVHVDQTNGTSGTVYPAGTPLQPVDNFTDAMTIAGIRGFSTLRIIGDATLDTGDDITGMAVIGQNPARTTLTMNAGAVIDNVDISECSVTGELDGNAIIRVCSIQNLTYFRGFLYQCEIKGTITLAGSAQADILSCYSGVTGTPPPTINFGGSGQALGLRAYSGGVRFTNKTGTDAANIDLISGEVRIDLTTVTNGSIIVRGTGKVVDDADTTDHLLHGTYGSLSLQNETTSGLMIQEMWLLQGLDPDNPMTVTPTSRSADGVSQQISGDGETTSTVTRI